MTTGITLNKNFIKVISVIVLSLYFIFPVYMFQSISSMDHSHDSHTPDCPYMSGESSLCPIKFFSHLQAWQSASITLGSLKTLIILFTLFILAILAPLRPPSLRLFLYKLRYKFQEILILYQTLFARGILNSKIYS